MKQDLYYYLVGSEIDKASETMISNLTKNGFKFNFNSIYENPEYPEIRLFVSNKNSLWFDDLEDYCPNAKAFIFLSKHSSKEKFPALTCHFTGNFEKNFYGGKEKELGIAYPSLQKLYLANLMKHKNLLSNFDIGMESTHHGPTSIKKPAIFIELGSDEQQWTDQHAASIICNTILDTIISLNRGKVVPCKKIAIGIGGNHYASKFNKILFDSGEFCFASIISKYYLKSLDRNMIEQMIQKSVEKITYAIVDNKGLGPERSQILNLLNDSELKILKI